MVYLKPGNLRAAEFQNSMWKKFDLEKNRLKKKCFEKTWLEKKSLEKI